jgi:hypothetical protein
MGMRRIETGDENQLAYREGGGWGYLASPVALIGLLMIVSVLTGNVTKGQGRPAGVAEYAAVSLLGSAFFGIGVIFCFGRRGLVFDRNQRTVARWYGLLIPMLTKVVPWDSFSEIAITNESGEDSTAYCVRLAGRAKLKVVRVREELEARRWAEELARFTGLPILDSSYTAAPVLREAAHVDVPLREQLRAGPTLDLAPPPPGMLTKVSCEGNTVLLQFPKIPWGASIGILVVTLLGVLLIGGGIPVAILADRTIPRFYAGLAAFVILLPLSVTLRSVWLYARYGCEVVASAQELRITQPGLLKLRVDGIPISELEEIRIEGEGKWCRLAALSDRQTVRFGQGLPREELVWIQTVLQKALSMGEGD